MNWHWYHFTGVDWVTLSQFAVLKERTISLKRMRFIASWEIINTGLSMWTERREIMIT
jgi:hypothetical protein